MDYSSEGKGWAGTKQNTSYPNRIKFKFSLNIAGSQGGDRSALIPSPFLLGPYGAADTFGYVILSCGLGESQNMFWRILGTLALTGFRLLNKELSAHACPFQFALPGHPLNDLEDTDLNSGIWKVMEMLWGGEPGAGHGVRGGGAGHLGEHQVAVLAHGHGLVVVARELLAQREL